MISWILPGKSEKIIAIGIRGRLRGAGFGFLQSEEGGMLRAV